MYSFQLLDSFLVMFFVIGTLHAKLCEFKEVHREILDTYMHSYQKKSSDINLLIEGDDSRESASVNFPGKKLGMRLFFLS